MTTTQTTAGDLKVGDVVTDENETRTVVFHKRMPKMSQITFKGDKFGYSGGRMLNTTPFTKVEQEA